MKITGARFAHNAHTAVQSDFFVRDGRIIFHAAARVEEPTLDLSGYLLLPGLINAHDHLELNLFPKLGSGPYGNAKQWADNIYHPAASPVKEHLAVSKNDRLIWGGLKNLFSGVTTVAHHNPLDDIFDDEAFPVRVVEQFGWAHSLDFAPDLQERYRATPPGWPFIIHAAEGIDARARSEVGKLAELGILSNRTVLVHALGLDEPGLKRLHASRTSLVWCPSSNLALYGETLRSNVLKSGLMIALGTDSAMTANGDFIDEIAIALDTGNLSLEEIYDMVTVRAACVLRLKEGQGSIQDGGVADLIACEDRGQTPASALRDLQIEMVMIGGKLKVATSQILDRCTDDCYLHHTVELEARGRWFTSVDVRALHKQTTQALGSEIRLAGKRVTV